MRSPLDAVGRFAASLRGHGLVSQGEIARDRRRFDEAMRIWRKAAERGSAEACYRIGELFARGEGVRRNLADASRAD